MIGILCEKPSAARNFADALGGMTGNFNGESYIIAASMGHLFEFKDISLMVPSSKKDHYKQWNIDNLPWNENEIKWDKELKTDRGQNKTLKTIENAFKGCSEIVIATDDDPSGEGELLAWEVLLNINVKPKKYTRMYFPDEAKVSIQKAFKNRKEIKLSTDGDYIKADFRSKWDYLSMQFTRIATLSGDGRSVLRQGRLKSPMVVLTGDAIAALESWKKNKKPFYEVKFKDEMGVTYTNPETERFPDKNNVPLNDYHVSDVICDKKEVKKTPPRALIDLAGLSSALSPKGIKPKDITSTYQKMYEAKVVSYPRTEDKKISEEQFNELLPLADKIASVVNVDKSLLAHRKMRSTHVIKSCAHGANRPGPSVPKSLDDVEKAYGKTGRLIYETLALSYLAMLCEDYEYEAHTGHLKDYPEFAGRASVPLKMGWKAVFNDIKDENDEDEDLKGLGKKASPYIHEGFPPKPPTPTQKWLMDQLSKYDVGTGATRVGTYADVTDDSPKNKYPLLKDTKGKLSMTKFGEMSYLMLKNTKIGDITLTERLFKDMELIAGNKKDPDVLLAEVKDLVVSDIVTMKLNGDNMRKTLNVEYFDRSKIKPKTEGVFNNKKVQYKDEWSGHKFTDDELKKLLNGEEIIIEAVSSKSGKPFKAKGKFEHQTFKGNKFFGFKLIDFVK